MSDTLLTTLCDDLDLGYLDSYDEVREALRCAAERASATGRRASRTTTVFVVDVDGSKGDDGSGGAGLSSLLTLPSRMAAKLQDHNGRIGTKRCELTAIAMAHLRAKLFDMERQRAADHHQQ